jgi:integrase
MASIYTRTWTNKTGCKTTVYLVEQRREGKKLRRQFSSRSAALRFVGSITAGAEAFTFGARKTFGDLTAIYFAQASFNDLERGTIRAYRSQVSCHLLPRLADTKIDQIGRERILSTMADLRASLSPAQTFNVFQTLRRILRFGVMAGMLGRDPTVGLRGPSRRVREHARGGDREDTERMHRFLRKPEIKKLALAVRGVGRIGPLPFDRAMVFVKIGLFSGLRASEIRGLQVRAIDLTEMGGSIRVYQRADEFQDIGPLKSRAAYRSVPICKRLGTTIKRWIELNNLNADDLLLGSQTGSPLNPSNFYNRDFRRFLESAGLTSAPMASDLAAEPGINGPCEERPDFSIHSLRHCYASLCIRLRVDVKKLAVRMGHSTIVHTLDLYGHLWRDEAYDQRDMNAFEAEMDTLVEGFDEPE